MMQSIERYMKQAIVDRNPAVSSAALVSSLVGEALVSFKNDQVFSLSFSFLSSFSLPSSPACSISVVRAVET